MYNFVHVLMMACAWNDGYYVAFQSTGSQYLMDVYMKKASNLEEALSNRKKKWVRQIYQMPWTAILQYLWWDTEGMEMTLWRNTYRYESGLTVAYRFLAESSKWVYATVVVPNMDQRSMQTSFLVWGANMEAYVQDTYIYNEEQEQKSSCHLPYFYKPKDATVQDILSWAEEHAHFEGYGHLIPFIRTVVKSYANNRWK